MTRSFVSFTGAFLLPDRPGKQRPPCVLLVTR